MTAATVPMRAVFCGRCGNPTGEATPAGTTPIRPFCKGCTDVPDSRSLSVHEDPDDRGPDSYECDSCGRQNFTARETRVLRYHTCTDASESQTVWFESGYPNSDESVSMEVTCDHCGHPVDNYEFA